MTLPSAEVTNRTLTTFPYRLIDWNETIKGVPVNQSRIIEFSSSIRETPAPVQTLPRLRLSWGGVRSRHIVNIDMPSHMKVSVCGTGVSVELLVEPDHPSALAAATGPVIDANVTIVPGFLPPKRLEWTSPPYDCDLANAATVPGYAIDVRAVALYTAAVGTVRSGALPPGRLSVTQTWWGPGAPANFAAQVFDLNDLINNPTPIGRVGGAPTVARAWGNTACSNVNTEAFRLVFGIEI